MANFGWEWEAISASVLDNGVFVCVCAWVCVSRKLGGGGVAINLVSDFVGFRAG